MLIFRAVPRIHYRFPASTAVPRLPFAGQEWSGTKPLWGGCLGLGGKVLFWVGHFQVLLVPATKTRGNLHRFAGTMESL